MATFATLKLQKFTKPQGLQKISITEKIDEKKIHEKQVYVVMLINMTDNCMQYAKINNGNLFAIPTVCRTCTGNDPDWCFDNHKYSPVMSCNCTDAPFNLTLA